MATLKTIRKRIASVKNTQKITKAMKMVAAARLRRAQQAVIAARPYANALSQVLQSVASRDSSENNPLWTGRDHPKKICYLAFTSNKGLCGGFNSNLLRRLETRLTEEATRYEIIDLKIIGKKGRDYYRTRRREPSEVFVELADSFPFEKAEMIAQGLIESFLKGEFDEYWIVYNQFRSAISQEIQFEKLLPVSLKAPEEATGSLVDFIFEPNRHEIAELLVPKLVATQLYRSHLESVASELGARMTAMESATKNAKEMIGALTLEYNRARQAVITKELMDIVNGAESVK